MLGEESHDSDGHKKERGSSSHRKASGNYIKCRIKYKPQLESYLIEDVKKDCIIDHYRWGWRLIMGSREIYHEQRCDFRIHGGHVQGKKKQIDLKLRYL